MYLSSQDSGSQSRWRVSLSPAWVTARTIKNQALIREGLSLALLNYWLMMGGGGVGGGVIVFSCVATEQSTRLQLIVPCP